MIVHPGQRVIIEGETTIAVRRLRDVDGGWLVHPPVQTISMWNEDAMTEPARCPECPTCGSDDPQRYDRVRVGTCPDPFHPRRDR